MRSSWSKIGPESSDSVLRRDKKRKGSHEDRGRDGKDAARSLGMPHLQAVSGAEEAAGTSPLEPLEGAQPCTHLTPNF